MMAGLIAAVVLAAGAQPAAAQELTSPTSDVVEGDDGSQTLLQSVVVEASVEQVWDAFTTESGYTAWAVPQAKIDLRIGGEMETSYGETFEPGSPQNIRNQIVSFVPQRQLVLRNVQAPPGFASRETLDRLFSVFEFEQLDENRTKITVHGVGYGTDEESLKLIDFFKAGNTWSFERLRAYFAGERG